MKVFSTRIASNEDCIALLPRLHRDTPDYLRLALRRAFNDYGNVEIRFYDSPSGSNQIITIGQNNPEMLNNFSTLGGYCQPWHEPCCTPEFFREWMEQHGAETTLDNFNPEFFRLTGLRLANQDGSTFAVESPDSYWSSITAATRTKINKLRRTFENLTVDFDTRIPDLSHLLPEYLNSRDTPNIFPSFQNVIQSHVELMTAHHPDNVVMIVRDGDTIVACNLARVIDGTLVDFTCVRSTDERYYGIGVWCIAKNIDLACSLPEIKMYSLGGAEVAYKSQFVPDMYRHMLTIPHGVYSDDYDKTLIGQYQAGGLTGLAYNNTDPVTKGYQTRLLKDWIFGDFRTRMFVNELKVHMIRNPVQAVRNNIEVFLNSLVLINPSGRGVAMQGGLSKVTSADYSQWFPLMGEQRVLNRYPDDEDTAALLAVAAKGGTLNYWGMSSDYFAKFAPEWVATTQVHAFRQAIGCEALTAKQRKIIDAAPKVECVEINYDEVAALIPAISACHPSADDPASYYRPLNWICYLSGTDAWTYVYRFTLNGKVVGYLAVTEECGELVLSDYWQPADVLNHYGVACLRAYMEHTQWSDLILTRPSRTGSNEERVSEAFARRFANSVMDVKSLFAAPFDASAPAFNLETMQPVLINVEALDEEAND